MQHCRILRPNLHGTPSSLSRYSRTLALALSGASVRQYGTSPRSTLERCCCIRNGEAKKVSSRESDLRQSPWRVSQNTSALGRAGYSRAYQKLSRSGGHQPWQYRLIFDVNPDCRPSSSESRYEQLHSRKVHKVSLEDMTERCIATVNKPRYRFDMLAGILHSEWTCKMTCLWWRKRARTRPGCSVEV